MKSANRKTVQIQVSGMSCASCVAKIERHIKKQSGKAATSMQSVFPHWYRYLVYNLGAPN